VAIRDEFQILPGVVFLNHGSFGACPAPVFTEYQRWQLELERQPVEFLGRRAKHLLAEARKALGVYVGAGGSDLVYYPNSTTAVNVIARSIDFHPGDEILTTDHEYGATERAWQFSCERTGAVLVRQHIQVPVGDPSDVRDAVWAGRTDRTRVLFLSEITSSTALRFPVKSLVQLAAQHGIITVIDGAHAPGQIDVDLAQLGCDFYVGTCHKWMCAPKGSAFLYARADVQDTLAPLVVSFGWHSESPGPSRFIDEHEYQGTRDISAFLSVPAAIEYMRQRDWPRVREASRALLTLARRNLGQLRGVVAVTGDTTLQMASFLLPRCDAQRVQSRLYDEYRIEVPVGRWGGRELLRVSVQAYNSVADIDALSQALSEVLAQESYAIN
jgi:isopenicillin-N epimerase